jgi:hypothetical protein
MGLESMIDSSLEPEIVLPEQFFGRSAASSSERRLMLAVLERAFVDLRSSRDARTRRIRRLTDEVDAWFAADDEAWPCSFLHVCHALGLDAAAIRSRLACWRVDARAHAVMLRIARRDRPAAPRKIAAAG